MGGGGPARLMCGARAATVSKAQLCASFQGSASAARGCARTGGTFATCGRVCACRMDEDGIVAYGRGGELRCGAAEGVVEGGHMCAGWRKGELLTGLAAPYGWMYVEC